MKVHIDQSKRYIFLFRGCSERDSTLMQQRIDEWLAGDKKILSLASTSNMMKLESVIEVRDDRERASTLFDERDTESTCREDIDPPPSDPFLYGPDHGFSCLSIAHRDSDGMLTAHSLPTFHGNIGITPRIKDFILWLNSRKTVSKQ